MLTSRGQARRVGLAACVLAVFNEWAVTGARQPHSKTETKRDDDVTQFKPLQAVNSGYHALCGSTRSSCCISHWERTNFDFSQLRSPNRFWRNLEFWTVFRRLRHMQNLISSTQRG